VRRAAEDLDRPAHRSQRIADLVREARRQPAYHRQPVGAAHRLFHLAQLGEVLEEDHVTGHLALLERRDGVADDALAAVVGADADFRAALGAQARDRLGQLGDLGGEELPAGGEIGEAGDLLGGAVQPGDPASFVEGEDAARHRAHHG
jgi:DNA-binding helix-hairpin-helix protein with protein kinase domain